MKLHLIIYIALLCAFPLKGHAALYQDADYSTADSLRIVSLLDEACALSSKPHSWMLWFGKKFLSVPYVGGTLDRATEERLVVNTRQLDCTTFVETVAALSLCAQKNKVSFEDFLFYLSKVRYIDGRVEYVCRQHYFSTWALHNEREGIVTEIHPNPPFTATQYVEAHWMTTHVANYKMLSSHPEWVQGIKALEKEITGLRCDYIPAASLANTALFRTIIHDGDIIAIVTSKHGLDTTHLGLASWHADGLHLLNASSIHHRVVDETKLLRTYLLRNRQRIGIRVVRLNTEIE